MYIYYLLTENYHNHIKLMINFKRQVKENPEKQQKQQEKSRNHKKILLIPLETSYQMDNYISKLYPDRYKYIKSIKYDMILNKSSQIKKNTSKHNKIYRNNVENIGIYYKNHEEKRLSSLYGSCFFRINNENREIVHIINEYSIKSNDSNEILNIISKLHSKEFEFLMEIRKKLIIYLKNIVFSSNLTNEILFLTERVVTYYLIINFNKNIQLFNKPILYDDCFYFQILLTSIQISIKYEERKTISKRKLLFVLNKLIFTQKDLFINASQVNINNYLISIENNYEKSFNLPKFEIEIFTVIDFDMLIYTSLYDSVRIFFLDAVLSNNLLYNEAFICTSTCFSCKNHEEEGNSFLVLQGKCEEMSKFLIESYEFYLFSLNEVTISLISSTFKLSLLKKSIFYSQKQEVFIFSWIEFLYNQLLSYQNSTHERISLCYNKTYSYLNEYII